MAKKTKIPRAYSPKKTTQTIHLPKKIFDKLDDEYVEYVVVNEALNYKLGKLTLKNGKSSKKVHLSSVMWMAFDELTNSDARKSGFKNLKELETHLKKEKSGLRSNSPVSRLYFY